MRDTKVLESFLKHTQKKLKEMDLFKFLKKEVETGANGTTINRPIKEKNQRNY